MGRLTFSWSRENGSSQSLRMEMYIISRTHNAKLECNGSASVLKTIESKIVLSVTVTFEIDRSSLSSVTLTTRFEFPLNERDRCSSRS